MTTTFEALLAELGRTRSHYEDLRGSNGPFADRAAVLTRLHSLRAEIATLRQIG